MDRFYGTLWQVIPDDVRSNLQRITRYTTHGKLRQAIEKLWQSFCYGILTEATFERKVRCLMQN